MLVTLAGQRQLILVTATRVIGLTVEEGALLWEYPWVTDFDVNATQPVLTGEDTFMISAGYGHGAALAGSAEGGRGHGLADLELADDDVDVVASPISMDAISQCDCATAITLRTGVNISKMMST